MAALCEIDGRLYAWPYAAGGVRAASPPTPAYASLIKGGAIMVVATLMNTTTE